MLAAAAQAQEVRVALWDIALERDGPGLLLRDITRGEDPQIEAAVEVIRSVAPDVLVMTSFDTDAEGRTLAAFAALFDDAYPRQFTKVGNEGRASGLDLDGNGRRGEPRDSLGFGRFPGNGGNAVLARKPYPLTLEQDFTSLLWRDLPAAELEGPTLSDAARDVQPLSSTGHWVLRAGPMQMMIHAATPPVFDGPEDRNGRRNHDEAALWLRLLDGALGDAPDGPFVISAKVNTDPVDGEGRKGALQALLAHQDLQDPMPRSAEAVQEATPGHLGDPALDTANWDDPVPGNLRVDYILPSQGWDVLDAGVMWPAPGSMASEVSRHGLIWVDLRLQVP